MEKKDRKGIGGRPKGRRYPVHVTAYLSEEDARRLGKLCELRGWERTQAVRELLREGLTRAGVTDPEEP